MLSPEPQKTIKAHVSVSHSKAIRLSISLAHPDPHSQRAHSALNPLGASGPSNHLPADPIPSSADKVNPLHASSTGSLPRPWFCALSSASPGAALPTSRHSARTLPYSTLQRVPFKAPSSARTSRPH